MHIDVCNGDADGLCAVVQWRLNYPRIARLVTGRKRDIELLAGVVANRGDQILVCDLSMQRNLGALMRLLEAGASVRYFDHHKIDNIPAHPMLEAHISLAADTCSSLLMDQYLGGRFRAWAVVGAFGDNLGGVAARMAQDLGLSAGDCLRLKSLGESINYNAYGDSDQDVWITPERLYAKLVRYPHPLVFLEQETIGQELRDRWAQDMQIALAWPPFLQAERASVYMYPDTAWSRRASASVGNQLAAAHPQRAHALIRATATGDFVVSVRSPLNAPMGAAEFCRLFGGDGRAAAAGIDHLSANQLEAFLAAFAEVHWGPPLDHGEESQGP